jgi:hypothetical protein
MTTPETRSKSPEECARIAASVLVEAQATTNHLDRAHLLAVAAGWRDLGATIAQYPVMHPHPLAVADPGFVQQFGEVAAGHVPPCSDMGNGIVGPGPGRAAADDATAPCPCGDPGHAPVAKATIDKARQFEMVVFTESHPDGYRLSAAGQHIA